MTNVMMRYTYNGHMFSMKEEAACGFAECMGNMGYEMEIFKAGQVPFDKLPDEVKSEAMDTLKAYDRVHVTYSLRKFHVSAGCCIKNMCPL